MPAPVYHPLIDACTGYWAQVRRKRRNLLPREWTCHYVSKSNGHRMLSAHTPSSLLATLPFSRMGCGFMPAQFRAVTRPRYNEDSNSYRHTIPLCRKSYYGSQKTMQQ